MPINQFAHNQYLIDSLHGKNSQSKNKDKHFNFRVTEGMDYVVKEFAIEFPLLTFGEIAGSGIVPVLQNHPDFTGLLEARSILGRLSAKKRRDL